MARVRVKIKDIPPAGAPDEGDTPGKEAAGPSVAEHQVSPEPIPFEAPDNSIQPPPVAHQQPAAPHPGGIIISRRVLIVGGIIVAVLLITAVAVINRDKADSDKTDIPPSAQTVVPDPQAEAAEYHQEISKYVDVPGDQTPSLVAVSDPAKLAEKSPVLFKNAQKGDVVLFYLNTDKTGKAILYRPSTKKLVAIVDGVNLGSGTGQTDAVPPSASQPKTTR